MSEVVNLEVSMIPPDEVDLLWEKLEPMFKAACEGNDIARDEFTAEDIYELAVQGLCAIFVGTVNNEPACVVAIQFHITNGRKGADIIAMGGKHLLTFKAHYWDILLEWLKANNVEFLDAYVPEDRADIYKRRFKFDKSCAHVRMRLQ